MCTFLNAHIYNCLEGGNVHVNEYMCGQNIPHLQSSLCVLLRGYLQVGGGVFENDYLFI